MTRRSAGLVRGNVLVTGGAGGIGAACVLALLAGGLRVFATARDARGLEAIAQAGATPIVMDLCDAASIEAGCAHLLALLGESRLDGLVHGAGIAAIGPWEHLPQATLRRLLEVNVVGVVAVTQWLLPRLRRDSGRIVLLSSVAGRLASPFLGGYACSKFALEAFADSLRRELRATGVKVVVVQPGAVRTPIWRGLDPGPPPAAAYQRGYQRFCAHVREVERDGLAPERVAAAVLGALVDARPPTRVLVTRRAPWLYRLVTLLPDRLVDYLLARRAGA